MRDESFDLGKRLGTLTRAQLQAALDRFGLGRLVEVRAADAGLFGQNVFLRTESSEWVLRGAPHWFRGKPHPTWQLAKERWFAERLHAATRAPVPWPYLVETSSDLFGWGYALMPRLPGERAEVALEGLPLEERLEIARAMGAALAELHSLRAPAPGDYDPDLDAIVPERSLSHYGLRVLADLRARAAAPPSVLDAEDHAFIDSVVRDTANALEVPVEPACIHLDYHWNNLNVERGADGWRVSGIFDLMTCEFGDPEMDLSRPVGTFAFEDQRLVAPFLEGYTRVTPLRAGARDRFRFFMLIDRLIIWGFVSRQQPGVFRPSDRFRTWAPFYLDFSTRV
jgi:aminoglycoside phosphotransferase (APT) family kinase protein